MRVCDVTVSAAVPPGCAAYRITEIPRRPASSQPGPARPDGGDPGRPQRAAALVAAYHAGIAKPAGTVAFGWVRAAAGGPVLMIAAGDALVGSADPAGGEVLLALPGGARGRAMPSGRAGGGARAARLLAGGSRDQRWPAHAARGIRGSGDRRGIGGARPGRAVARRGAARQLDRAVRVAGDRQPVTAAGLRALAEEVGLRQRIAEGSADRFPERAAQARRLKERHAELQRGLSTGFWRIAIVAGGGTSRARPGSPGCCAHRPIWTGCRTR